MQRLLTILFLVILFCIPSWSAAVTHFECEQVTQQTHTGDTNFTTKLTCASSNFVANKQYIIFASAQIGVSTGDARISIRLASGATPTVETGSLLSVGIQSPTEELGWGYFQKYTVPGTPVDMFVQVSVASAANTIRADSIVVNGICLDCAGELTTNDWKFNENTTLQDVNTTPVSGATITFTPSVTGDWLVMANCAYDDNGTVHNFNCFIDGAGATVPRSGVENEVSPATNGTWTLGRVYSLTATTEYTFTLKADTETDPATDDELVSSRIFALRLDAFESHCSEFNAGPVDMNGTITVFTEVANCDVTPATAGNMMLMGFGILDSTPGPNSFPQVRAQLTVGGTVTPVGYEANDVFSGWSGSGEELAPVFSQSIVAVAASAQDFDFDLSSDAATDNGINSTIVAFSMELAPATSPALSEAGSFSGFWPGTFEIQAQALSDGEEEAAYVGAQFVALNGKAPHAWAVSGGALPAGLSLSAGGALTGTPAAASAGAYPFTLEATDADGGLAYGDFSIVVQDSGTDTLAFYEDCEDGNLTANPTWTAAGGSSCTSNGFMEGADEVSKTTATDSVWVDNVNLPEVYFGFDIYRNGAAFPDTHRDQVLIGLGSSDEVLFSCRVETDWDIFCKTVDQPDDFGRGFHLLDPNSPGAGYLGDGNSIYIECHYAKGTGANATFRCRRDGGTLMEFFAGTATVNVDRIIFRDENDDATQNFHFDRVEAKSDTFPGRGALVPPGPPPAQQPWERDFTVLRTHYVTPTGTGNGDIGTPEDLSDALSHDQAGDLHILRGGTYTGNSTMSADGTATNPIIWKCFIDSNGDPENCNVDGSWTLSGDWNWVWAMNNEDATTLQTQSAFELEARGTAFINSRAVRYPRGTGLDAFNYGPDMVIYGATLINNGWDNRISAPRQNTYTQNTFDTNGWKYFVQLVSLDQPNCENCPNPNGPNLFHNNFSPSGGGQGTGYHVQDSMFNNGRVLVGNQHTGFTNGNPPASRWRYHNNWYDTGLASAYFRTGNQVPAQLQITDSLFRNTRFEDYKYWGALDACFSYFTDEHSIFTGNKIWSPINGKYMKLTAWNYAASCNRNTQGAAKIRDVDEWDNNTYGPSGAGNTFDINANGSNLTGRTLAQWRTDSGNARETGGGADFDLSSTETALPTTDQVECFDNFYEPGWGYCRGINWDGNGSLTITGTEADKIIGNGKTYKVRNARDFHGTALESGTYTTGAGIVVSPLPVDAVNGVLVVWITSQP